MLFIKSSRQRLPNSLPSNSELQGPSSTALRFELARRLHDGPAQDLAALGYRLDAVIGDRALSPGHRKELREIRLDLIGVMAKLRDELYLVSLRDLRSLRTELPKILPGFTIEFELPEESAMEALENSLALLIFEIARNAAKHSNGNRFWVKVQNLKSSLVLRIGDDGNTPISLKERSLGLRLINFQVDTLNGTIELQSGATGNEYLIEIPKS